MSRTGRACALVLLAPLLLGQASFLPTPPPLEALGWRKGGWAGLAPARFDALPGGGLRIAAAGQGSFVWRPLQGEAGCLAWRWRVDSGPPATDLTRRGGDDRAIAITVGFAGWPPGASFGQRAQHALAQAAAGDHPLPRSMLTYVWGGTGQEPARFASPWMGGLGQVRVLRPAATPPGRMHAERVDLAADWRAAFGGPPPPLQEIAIGTDADDTRSRVEAVVEGLVHGPCR